MKYKRLVSETVNLDKLKKLYPSLTADQVKDFMIRHKLGTKDSSKFADIAERAIQKNEKLNMVYGAAEDNFREERRIISPLAFQVKKPKFENQEYIYLVAYNYEGGVRTYRFDRIKELKTTSKDADYPDGGYSPYYDYYSDVITPDYYNSDKELPNYSKDLI